MKKLLETVVIGLCWITSNKLATKEINQVVGRNDTRKLA